MNKFLLILVIMCNFCVICANAVNDTIWCRPVSDTQADWNPITKKGVKVKVFRYEWFATQAKNIGNIILGNDILVTNNLGVVVYSLKAPIEGHEELPISFGRDHDSLYIKVPEVEDSKWFYVINQTKNKRLDSISGHNGKYVEIVCKDLNDSTILRVSPENHVASLIRVKDIPVVKVDTCVEVKDSLRYEYRKIGEEQLGEGKLLGPVPPIPNPDPDLDWLKWAFVIVGLMVICSISYFVFFMKRKKKTNIGGYLIVVWEKRISSKKIAETHKLSTVEELPHKDLVPGQNVLMKGILFQTVEYLIPPEWQVIEESVVDNQKIRGVLDSFKLLFKQKAENGDIYGVNSCSSFIKYFRYSVLDSELKEKYKELLLLNEGLMGEVKDLKQKIAATEKRVKEEINQIKEDAKKRISSIEKDTEIIIGEVTDKITAVEKERDQAKKKAETIKDELIEQFGQEKRVITEERDSALSDLATTKSALSNAGAKLNSMMYELEVSNTKVSRLEKAQEMYSTKLTYVPFAEGYSAKIQSLIDIAININKSAVALLDIQLEDPYHIMKCIAKYNKALSLIDMDMFYTDVNMIAKGGMVLEGTVLSTYNQDNSKDQLYNSMKLYFFDNYLAKYVNAIVVLNESLAGIDRMVEGLTEKDVRQFKQYRSEIEDAVRNLEITVEAVRLFEKVGNKIDLRVTQIDAGFSTGEILEIENCIVYLAGAHRPDAKIYVKAQE
ncbi:Smc domain-containing protein [Bacteroides thetaiotaomicron]|uniref:hypothetical protein n=1 Tax=Bacteroides thetaiotaomicron TaxID=818 RepID=UPI00189A5364|nr:hypothetical protein [Bacteroides thetaiotaomicron]